MTINNNVVEFMKEQLILVKNGCEAGNLTQEELDGYTSIVHRCASTLSEMIHEIDIKLQDVEKLRHSLFDSEINSDK